MERTLIVVSYYDGRTIKYLKSLLKSMKEYSAGSAYDLCIVVNSTSEKKIKINPKVANVIYHENIGMNIGAWDYGWRMNPNYRDYLFLQDECYVVKNNWLSSFQRIFKESNVGMVGESINEKWNKDWEKLHNEQQSIKMREHELDGELANRVDVYLNFMRRNKIDPGRNGRHLRSLVWYLDRVTLEKIGGFPIGTNYGECIASEIAVSKSVEETGKTIVQVSDEAFKYIRHLEWNKCPNSSHYRHDSLYQELNNGKLSKLNALLITIRNYFHRII